jgi:hypothetical protein
MSALLSSRSWGLHDRHHWRELRTTAGEEDGSWGGALGVEEHFGLDRESGLA